MKYVCLGYHEEAAWQAIPADQRERLMQASFAYMDVLRASGHLIDEQALQSATTATTLRFTGGTMLITDGPFAETKEQLGGLIVLEASDLNHAIQLMSKMPCMRADGCLEIRPINEDLFAGMSEPDAAVVR